jgi:hypothetical protein
MGWTSLAKIETPESVFLNVLRCSFTFTHTEEKGVMDYYAINWSYLNYSYSKGTPEEAVKTSFGAYQINVYNLIMK